MLRHTGAMALAEYSAPGDAFLLWKLDLNHISTPPLYRWTGRLTQSPAALGVSVRVPSDGHLGHDRGPSGDPIPLGRTMAYGEAS